MESSFHGNTVPISVLLPVLNILPDNEAHAGAILSPEAKRGCDGSTRP